MLPGVDEEGADTGSGGASENHDEDSGLILHLWITRKILTINANPNKAGPINSRRGLLYL